MAVQLVVHDILLTVGIVIRVFGVVRHAIVYSLGNVLNDNLILVFCLVKFAGRAVKFDEHLPVLLPGAVTIVSPALVTDVCVGIA